MSSITNINNNSAVVNVGRTTPVSPGQQPAARSIPVVLASDQTPVPVEEQNKIQSEVALSLLGIPRAEVALGIFADVNTYDVNPSEWSSLPISYISGYGVRHLPQEAGALIEAPRNANGILTSKRFFRYQPGRVSAATFGVKSSVTQSEFAQNPVIRKYGIFDNFDGYYWETRENAQGDNFSVVRRMQSLLIATDSPFGREGDALRGDSPVGTVPVTQVDDYRFVGKAASSFNVSPENFIKDRATILENKFDVVTDAYTATTTAYTSGQTITYASTAPEAPGTFSGSGNYYDDLAQSIYGASFTADNVATVTSKCFRDALLWVDRILDDLEWGGSGHVITNITNFDVALIPNGSIFEGPFYANLETELVALTDAAADARITTLVGLVEAFYNSGTVPTADLTGTSASVWGRGKLETIYSVKGLYWGYLATEYKANDDPAQYFAASDTGQTTPITDPDAVIYTSSIGRDFTLAEVKAKCQRDTNYLVQGWKNDILGGGNAETKYNASMYLKGTGMSIASQGLVEIDRQTGTKARILDELENTFGYSTSSNEYLRQVELADLVIDNFTEEDITSVVIGERGFAGNLVVFRDGLLNVHAGVFDPSLLKDAESIKSYADADDNTFTLSKGEVTFGQHVKLKTGINANLVADTVYKVYSTDGFGTKFKLQDNAGAVITFTSGEVTAAGDIYFETVAPFIFPTNYDPTVFEALTEYTDDTSNDRFPDGMMFPYMYAKNENLADANTFKVGYIDTTISPDDTTNADLIRTQYDALNFVPEYINWIKNNVKPEYYGVYEYRIPRTRFTHDKLDGRTTSSTPSAFKEVYSDIATKEDGTIGRPGEIVTENLEQVVNDSVYDFDFTKVTMLKIEFSWYGAVGALFLAYVPVGNGEARWVRVHHLRASNQLKVPSLGNATLPITYNVYGGGDNTSKGNQEDGNGITHGYASESHNIVKYGASYYIDGGDRGTVRLYSHANADPREAFGKRWALDANAATWTAADNSIDLAGAGVFVSGATATLEPTYFMKSRVDSGNRIDQGIYVEWVQGDVLYLSSQPNGWNVAAPGNFDLLPDRSNSLYGLETKENIISTVSGVPVRNRVQVYPTKLSTSNLGTKPVRLRLRKTPTFQPNVTTSGTISVSSDYTITSAKTPLAVTESSAPFMANGESVYGWFRAKVDSVDTGESITVFGKLYKEGGSYYFDLLETVQGTVILHASDAISSGQFLPDGRYDAESADLAVSSRATPFELEGLSSILVRDDALVPVPETGTDVATIYLQPGTEQLDLQSYFDYNKDYLSYPLTNQTESLYLVVDTNESSNTSYEVSVGVTWEEQ